MYWLGAKPSKFTKHSKPVCWSGYVKLLINPKRCATDVSSYLSREV
jgi:hypothetical protein